MGPYPTLPSLGGKWWGKAMRMRRRKGEGMDGGGDLLFEVRALVS